jgi:hypothetical protein
VWLLTLAIGLVGVALFVVVRPAIQPALSEPAQPHASAEPRPSTVATTDAAPRGTPAALQAPAAATPATIAASQNPSPTARSAQADSTPRPTTAPEAVPGTPAESAPETTPEEAMGEQPSGIQLFPPPGTKPIKRGIVVPEDFELPPGYVRHYQTTDEGYQLPAILMFHPDYQPLDERGEPIPLPENRVVPPEMAPPGMPAQTLDVPEKGAPVSPEQAEQAARRSRPHIDVRTEAPPALDR